MSRLRRKFDRFFFLKSGQGRYHGRVRSGFCTQEHCRARGRTPMYHGYKWLGAIFLFACFLITVFGIPPAQAGEVNITANMPFVDIRTGGKVIRIQRIQDTNHKLTNSFAKTSRACPPFCVHPMKASHGVETVGELELIKFLKATVEKKKGLLVDARIPSFYKKGTIPGAVNIPFNLFAPNQNPYYEKILAVLGAVKTTSGQWDFSNALALMLFCNGPWCDQSPRAIRNLVSVGYPTNRLFYYRGGMQNWQGLGFNIAIP